MNAALNSFTFSNDTPEKRKEIRSTNGLALTRAGHLGFIHIPFTAFQTAQRRKKKESQTHNERHPTGTLKHAPSCAGLGFSDLDIQHRYHPANDRLSPSLSPNILASYILGASGLQPRRPWMRVECTPLHTLPGLLITPMAAQNTRDPSRAGHAGSHVHADDHLGYRVKGSICLLAPLTGRLRLFWTSSQNDWRSIPDNFSSFANITTFA